MSEIIEKLYKGEELNESEIQQLTWDDVEGSEVFDIRYNNELNRWSRYVRTIIKIGDDFWCIDWDQGLTEYQESSYHNQPFKVKMVTKQIAMTVVDFERI